MPIIVFTGGLGQGKTLSMTMYARLLYEKSGRRSKLYANYGLKGAIRVRSFKDLLDAEQGILALDEAHITLDSRNFKDKSSQKMTHWLLQTRKANLTVLMTSQGFDQIDIRARRVTDVIVECEKIDSGGEITFKLTFIDWPKRRKGRIQYLRHPQKMYGFYDTYEKIDAIE